MKEFDMGKTPHFNTKHGKSRSRIYGIWRSMKKRCHSKSHVAYSRYSKKGIIVCDRWMNSFNAFYKDMGDPPTEKHCIDRIDNNSPYNPENCRWATYTQNNRNRFYEKRITYHGVSISITELAEELGVNRSALYSRAWKGWSVDDMIEIPITAKNRWINRKGYRLRK